MFGFTIRDVLWLTLAAGLALGWWIDHKRQATELFELNFRVFFSAPQDTDL